LQGYHQLLALAAKTGDLLLRCARNGASANRAQ
jgi:hypothetical protein